ncbi:MAG: hypothetical protein PUC88_00645 [Clostridia bacterium]|nr:hypothetical protein [Clostridia bacterium]
MNKRQRKKLMNMISSAGLLPSAYERLDYIESTGGQYIEAINSEDAYNLFSGLKMETEQAITRPKAQSEGAGNLTGFNISTTSNDLYYRTTTPNAPNYTDVPVKLDEIHKICTYFKGSNAQISVDDKPTKVSNVENLAQKKPLLLFSHGSNLNQRCCAKKYSCKIWADNYAKLGYKKSLIRDFIPCYRKSDKEIGMYDLITKKFYANSGQGMFRSSPNVDVPFSNFQSVEYIESTGTQYINSFVNNTISENRNLRVIADVEFSGDATGVMFGMSPSGKESERFSFAVSNDKWSLRTGGYTLNSSSIVEPNVRYGIEIYISPDLRTITVNNELVGTDVRNTIVNEMIEPFFLFVDHICKDDDGGNICSECSYLKLYSLKIYENDVLIRDYIPCYKTSDENNIGLYEKVEKRFYGNDGTGIFLKGEDVYVSEN